MSACIELSDYLKSHSSFHRQDTISQSLSRENTLSATPQNLGYIFMYKKDMYIYVQSITSLSNADNLKFSYYS